MKNLINLFDQDRDYGLTILRYLKNINERKIAQINESNSLFHTPIIMCAQRIHASKNYFLIAEKLVSNGANLNHKGVMGTALGYCAYVRVDNEDHKKLVKLLLENGASLTSENESILVNFSSEQHRALWNLIIGNIKIEDLAYIETYKTKFNPHFLTLYEAHREKLLLDSTVENKEVKKSNFKI